MKFVLAALPFIGILGGVGFANRVEPYVIGLPFFLFYIVLWIILTGVIMGIVYKIDPKNKEENL
jgi:hypothetical protein